MEAFTQEEIYRYSRHFSVSSVGISGQQKLKQSKVLLIGVGGIGSPAGLYLTSNGIGTLGLIDHDTIELSNLQRQILYETSDTGLSKAKIAAKKLSALNPNVNLKTYPFALSPDNANALFEEYDIVIDGSDNYATRYLVNDACRQTSTALVSASIYQFTGQIASFIPDESPCYRCLYPAPPPPGLIPNCAGAGVLGVIPGVLATLAVAQVLKLILNIGDSPVGQLVEFDALKMSLQTFEINSNPNCECCKQQKDFSMTHANNLSDKSIHEISPAILADLIKSNTPITLIDVRENWEREICRIEPSLHIPLGTISSSTLTCSKEAAIILYCKAGVRSLKAAKILLEKGYENVSSLKGGALRWIDEIQPELMKY